MRPARIRALAEQALVIHQPGCDAVDLPAPLTPGPGLDRDDFIRYGLALRPGYDRLGRVLGQLAGLLILARLGSRFESDWPTVATVVEQALHAESELRGVAAPVGAHRHHACLLGALQATLAVVRAFSQTMPRGEGLHSRLDAWTRDLQAAGRTLSGCAIEGLGLMPLDFSQACCSCAAAPVAATTTY